MVLEPHVLEILTPDKRVLLWCDNLPLGHTTPGLATVDYLLDGLVCGHLNSNADQELNSVVFSHPLYGQTFWVAFVNLAKTTPQDFLPSFIAVMPAPLKETLVLYTTTPLSSQWEHALSKAFTKIQALP